MSTHDTCDYVVAAVLVNRRGLLVCIITSYSCFVTMRQSASQNALFLFVPASCNDGTECAAFELRCCTLTVTRHLHRLSLSPCAFTELCNVQWQSSVTRCSSQLQEQGKDHGNNLGFYITY